MQFNRHLEFKARVNVQVKAGDKDAFRKAPSRKTVKSRVMAQIKAEKNVY